MPSHAPLILKDLPGAASTVKEIKLIKSKTSFGEVGRYKTILTASIYPLIGNTPGDDGCASGTAYHPCGECQGDCDGDIECKPGL